MFVRLFAPLLMLTLLAACGGSAPPASTDTPAPRGGSCTLALADGVGDEEAITALVRAEGELVVAQEIDPLMALWVEDGVVADAKYTPDQPDDDQRWIGGDAIRHRYVRAVFPGAPTTVQPADLQIVIQGDAATVRSTTRIGDEVAPSGDRWELVNVDGCWMLNSLTYNLEQPN